MIPVVRTLPSSGMPRAPAPQDPVAGRSIELFIGLAVAGTVVAVFALSAVFP